MLPITVARGKNWVQAPPPKAEHRSEGGRSGVAWRVPGEEGGGNAASSLALKEGG